MNDPASSFEAYIAETRGVGTLGPDIYVNKLFFTDGSVQVTAANSVSNSLPRVFVASISQGDTNPPVCDLVFENTLGGVPVWSYVAPGQYNLSLAGAFPDGRTLVEVWNGGGFYTDPSICLRWGADDSLYPDSLAFFVTNGDNQLPDYLFLKITVYP